MTLLRYRSLTLTISFLILWAWPVIAQDKYVPVYNPTLTITETTGEISIDGKLNDPGWRKAGKADNFAEHNPGDQTKPPVNTEAFVTYDQSNLYVAMICYDDPSTIRASFSERDRIFSDDNICFLLDTYGDATWAYEFNVNPYGIQGDLLWSSNYGEDSGFDLIWESAGIVTDSGYQVELAIPFSSLRFPNQEEQTWRMDFWRNHPRDMRRQYSWAAYDRDEGCWPCQWGTVSGIKNVQPGRGIEILPSLIAYQSGSLTGSGKTGSPYEFDNSDPDGEFSLNGKYAISSDVVLEAAYNPDFSQVESDADQIDVNTTFALSFPEKRPFFQEGADLFRTIFDAVYTRSINDPEFASKLTARMGRTSVAVLTAADENTPMILPFEEYSRSAAAGKSYSNILRARQTFGEDSRLGGLITDRRLDGGGSNTLLSADGSVRLSKKYRFDFQTMATHTEEADDDYLNEQFGWVDTLVGEDDLNDPTIPDSEKFDTLYFDDGAHTVKLDGESFWGHAIYAGFSRETANSYSEISWLDKSPTYRADAGFQPRNDQRRILAFGMYHFRFDEGLFERITPSVQVGTDWNFTGQKKNEYVDVSLEGNLRFAQSSFHGRWLGENELYHGIQFDDLWLAHMCVHSTPGNLLAFGANINYGHRIARSNNIKGKETGAGIWWDIRPSDRLFIENWYSYAKSLNKETDERLYEGFTYRTRLSYQFTRELSLRVVGQYNDFSETWDFDPLLTYRLNPFSIFYIGTTMDYGQCKEYEQDSQTSEDVLTGTCTRLASRQFFMKLQYLFQL